MEVHGNNFPDFLEVRENDALDYYNAEVPDGDQRNSKEPSNEEGKINEKSAFDGLLACQTFSTDHHGF